MHFQDSVVYGFRLAIKQFNGLCLTADGICDFSSGAGDWGFGTISFNEDKYEINRMTYSETDASTEPVTIYYYVNKESATADEFHLAVEMHDSSDHPIWYDITDENIETRIY